MPEKEVWLESRKITPEKMRLARLALAEIYAGEDALSAIKHHPTATGYIGKNVLVAAYNAMVDGGEIEANNEILAKIRMKPVRTLSGVTTVTVLTKHYPCPGECIFCPDDVRMPKSYLPDEPGAMRALHHKFAPFEQVEARLEALRAVGHPTDKIELLILGGTWSSYRRDYQEWFITRCFDALNKKTRDSEIEVAKEGELEKAHRINESAQHRNVGLVVETRPDEVTPEELAWFRYLGVTKIQMGAQSLDNEILALNKRGHTVEELHRAMALLRAGGFKIVLHWMPNLLGATLESDREDFQRLWGGIAPDEIKVYPTQLLENTELHEAWERGEYKPYTTKELINLLADVKPSIPRYCRANRVIRDIPSTNVVEGNKRTSLRQDVHREMATRGTKCDCLRCREVRGKAIEIEKLKLDDLKYQADDAEEHFISFITSDDKVAGFLRLSLPNADAPKTGISDLEDAAIIREVHVYGLSLEVGSEKSGSAQHVGLGTRLMLEAEQVALKSGFSKMAIIAAVGTRGYYLDRGFKRGELYLVKEIK
ncbi:MAG: tRNA uridine(34) 5-carboxymethylaminomethyl modification radical SAM/GNAT enzyme Elp3 [Anaerolineae bacterium]|jgi:elongator complex protein 3|nr:tRNA uridine(34) 5-carboxymethylaminomethyl modification radical SAM/GNAT enzyme Elp3 [Anaerolineae bacterium]MBT7190042.1 tRNA uridine(34) 5-carboxymethylaminomethyl modification radical SAM/GNAT enzyme Elp3 [Anaerolineae bacterium]